jgi:hypothetical protein
MREGIVAWYWWVLIGAAASPFALAFLAIALAKILSIPAICERFGHDKHMDRRPENFGGYHCTICKTEWPPTDFSKARDEQPD